jgi:hypothetical protein
LRVIDGEALERAGFPPQNRAMRPASIPLSALCTGLILALTGCWGGGDSERTPAPQESMTSTFFAGTPSQIETVIIDPLPVAGARLVTADGVTIAAKEIVREKNAYADQESGLPHIAVGAAGGSQTQVTTGIGIEFPLFGGGGNPTAAVSMTTSTITFTVPDRAVYEETWQHWRLHLDLGDGANGRSIETLPPKPPR